MATVLVIDDDPVTREVVKTIMNDEGHTVLEAANGKMGIEIYRNHSVDIVITDLYMPEKEGIETILELKSITPNVKIIVVTGGFKGIGQAYSDIGYLTKDFGAAYVVSKPIDIQTLTQHVQTLLSQTT